MLFSIYSQTTYLFNNLVHNFFPGINIEFIKLWFQKMGSFSLLKLSQCVPSNTVFFLYPLAFQNFSKIIGNGFLKTFVLFFNIWWCYFTRAGHLKKYKVPKCPFNIFLISWVSFISNILGYHLTPPLLDYKSNILSFISFYFLNLYGIFPITL